MSSVLVYIPKKQFRTKVFPVRDRSTTGEGGRNKHRGPVDALRKNGRTHTRSGLGQRTSDRELVCEELNVYIVSEVKSVGVPRDINNLTRVVRGVSILECRNDRRDHWEGDRWVRGWAVEERVSEGVCLRRGERGVEVDRWQGRLALGSER